MKYGIDFTKIIRKKIQTIMFGMMYHNVRQPLLMHKRVTVITPE